VKRPLAWCGLLLFAACGYHDTPVATYEVVVLGGSSGSAGAAASGTAGSGGTVEQAAAGNGGESASAGMPPEPACWQTYTTVVSGLTSRYRHGATRLIWVEAERDCETDGGHLVVIDSDAENTWLAQVAAESLTNQASSHQLAWLGMSDHAKEGEFVWVTGTPLTLTSWFKGEPNTLNDAEDCGEMRASGLWNDDRCNAQLAYVCECDGQPPSAAAWCDTDDEQTCGDCSTSCGADQSCVSQLCK
jgi:hypothetical protein